MAGWIEAVGQGEAGKKQTIRRLLSGEKWTGKSVLMLQAQAMAFLKGWVVITIPEGTTPIFSSLPYVFIHDS